MFANLPTETSNNLWVAQPTVTPGTKRSAISQLNAIVRRTARSRNDRSKFFQSSPLSLRNLHKIKITPTSMTAQISQIAKPDIISHTIKRQPKVSRGQASIGLPLASVRKRKIAAFKPAKPRSGEKNHGSIKRRSVVARNIGDEVRFRIADSLTLGLETDIVHLRNLAIPYADRLNRKRLLLFHYFLAPKLCFHCRHESSSKFPLQAELRPCRYYAGSFAVTKCSRRTSHFSLL